MKQLTLERSQMHPIIDTGNELLDNHVIIAHRPGADVKFCGIKFLVKGNNEYFWLDFARSSAGSTFISIREAIKCAMKAGLGCFILTHSEMDSVFKTGARNVCKCLDGK